MTVISCTGYGNSGSSAATNFLEEFDDIYIVPHIFECSFLHEPDGLMDLYNAVKEGHRLKVDAAVHKFMNLSLRLEKEQYNHYFEKKFYSTTLEFISKTFTCKWHGFWHRSEDFVPLSRRKINQFCYLSEKYSKIKKNYDLYEQDNWRPSYIPFVDMYYSPTLECFIHNAKKYVLDLMSILNKSNSDFLVVDQLTPPISTKEYEIFFDKIKTIVIDRDPRDLYTMNKVYWGSRYIPSENLETFINWYHQTRIEKTKCLCSNVLYLNLEDMIYDYENSSTKIITFLGINNIKQSGKLSFFNPELSVMNTKRWLYFPELEHEINSIETKLKQFLFLYDSQTLLYNKTKQINFIETEIKFLDTKLEQGFNIKDRLEFFYLTLSHFKDKFFVNVKNYSDKKSFYTFTKILFYFVMLPFNLILYIIKGVKRAIYL